jgi:gliding motility-associated lipoprotein GldH
MRTETEKDVAQTTNPVILMQPIRKTLLGLFALSLVLVSCGEKPYYETYIDTDKEGWKKEGIAKFELEIEDTNSAYLVYFNLRANSNYTFSNLYLFRKIYSEDGLEYSDTAELTLADPYGKWLGEGLGELKTFSRIYRKEPLRFNRPGIYRFEFTHAMRENPLQGIEDIGLTIYKKEHGEAESH